MTRPGPDGGRALTPPVRWWQRAVPVGLVAALSVGAAVYALPDEELELSTTRLPQEYVELSLTGPPRAVCGTRAHPRARVRFRLVNRLEQTHTFRYRVTVHPVGARRESVRKRGRVRLEPGESTHVRSRLARSPARAHVVTIRLAQRPEQLRVHCHRQRQQEVST
ncbi:hypothetical protein [Nocardioides massiliensis]|uniref:DUF1616 domain-containing protein n=1 Tax=Nocardioides massiliensis TaxID=1325935 RepID=A0ABT9NMU5_9ACTN|nr:hypothetical protein [Nocardioides massiliensis]MDP9821752.1 hypothetical protein [Nocardioides massiliensis]